MFSRSTKGNPTFAISNIMACFHTNQTRPNVNLNHRDWFLYEVKTPLQDYFNMVVCCLFFSLRDIQQFVTLNAWFSLIVSVSSSSLIKSSWFMWISTELFQSVRCYLKFVEVSFTGKIVFFPLCKCAFNRLTHYFLFVGSFLLFARSRYPQIRTS